MINISLPYFFNMAGDLEPLSSLPMEEVNFGEVFFRLVNAEQALIGFYNPNSLYGPYLRSSVSSAARLLEAIQAQISQENLERTVPPYGLLNIVRIYEQHKVAFLAELGSLWAYFVTQKGPYDTHSILMSGESLFPADLISKVPEAAFDAKEVGRCLAFEVPTACGFHAFRATESVVRRYYSESTSGKPQPKVRNLGVYLNAMKQAGVGDPKVLAALKQMADLHRNPLIHPEAVLTTDEAIATIGVARSVITAMLAALPVVPPTTTTSVGAT